MPSMRRLQWPLLRALAAAVSLGTTHTAGTAPTPPPRVGSVRLAVRSQGALRERWLRANAGTSSPEVTESMRRRRGEKRTTTAAFLPSPGAIGHDAVRYTPRRPLLPPSSQREPSSSSWQSKGARVGTWSSVSRAFSAGENVIFGRGAQRRRPREQQQQPGAARGNGGRGGGLLYMREGIFQALPFPVRITVMGGGNFGLALSLVLARNQIPTTLLVRTESVAEHINTHHEHPKYLQGILIPQHVHATSDPVEALKDATYIIHAVPVQYTRRFLEKVSPHMPPGAPILSVSKGIETSSLMLMNDILKEACGAERSYAFLSGPSFAREIAMNQATAVVIASDDTCLSNDFAKVLSSPSFRCFTSKDVIGVEVGGAVKNVIALAAGMCEGLGLELPWSARWAAIPNQVTCQIARVRSRWPRTSFLGGFMACWLTPAPPAAALLAGTNAMAGLVTRGCGEMRRMAVILGGQPRTLSGLSGVGDTFGTCFGPLSRNRNFGIRLGKGESMAEILASSTEVAEGVDTALALADLIRKIDKSYRIDLKYAIIFGVADILKGKRSPKEGLEDLMTMPLRAEMYDS